MSILDATASAIGEAAAYLAAQVLGREFRLQPKQAQRIGEYLVMGLIAGVALLVTVIYS